MGWGGTGCQGPGQGAVSGGAGPQDTWSLSARPDSPLAVRGKHAHQLPHAVV